ncbi:helix-turn-helix domain-containing protein [Treponema socranskii]|uniref:AraC family transcriptional regulator n=1 Tax=Treponema socranskii TaxID=53419 RepID=UPI003D7005A6
MDIDSTARYTPFYPQKLISVDAIVTVHYFEYRNTFSFAGERHDFWELVCVDKGEIEIYDGKAWSRLRRGQIRFHKPNEFHALKANGIDSPNVIVISFICTSYAIDFFRDKTLSYTQKEQSLLAEIIAHARNLFITPLDDPYLTKMEARTSASHGEAQLIVSNLELLLLSLYRMHTEGEPAKQTRVSSYARLSYEDEIVKAALEYFNTNMFRMLRSDEICDNVHVSYDLLKSIFSKRFGCGPMKYFARMRIDEIKTLIRNSVMNVSELASHFGYSSIHYFSRQFKNETGMSPTEYATSIKAKTEKKFG